MALDTEDPKSKHVVDRRVRMPENETGWKDKTLSILGGLVILGVAGMIVTDRSLAENVSSLGTQVTLLQKSVDDLTAADHDRYTATDARRDLAAVYQRFDRDEQIVDAMRYNNSKPATNQRP